MHRLQKLWLRGSETFPDQEQNPRPLHWQATNHDTQGSPKNVSISSFITRLSDLLICIPSVFLNDYGEQLCETDPAVTSWSALYEYTSRRACASLKTVYPGYRQQLFAPKWEYEISLSSCTHCFLFACLPKENFPNIHKQIDTVQK